MSLVVSPTIEELRPLLHAEVDRLPASSLQILHRVALQLELEELTSRLDEGFDEARAAGRMNNLPEIIREARIALKQRAAS